MRAYSLGSHSLGSQGEERKDLRPLRALGGSVVSHVAALLSN